MNDGEVTENGKMMAVLSYGSLLMGVPLGIIPMVQRDDDFALFHAKHSLVIVLEFLAMMMLYFGCFAVSMLAFFFTCGMSNFVTVPLLMAMIFIFFLPGIPMAHGLLLALNGERKAPFGTFGIAQLLFSKIEYKPVEKLTSGPDT